MGNQENPGDSFKEQWKEALHKAEIQPRNAVWQSVEHKLAETDLKIYKGKAAIYKWAAISAIVIAAAVSVPQSWFVSNQNIAIFESNPKTEQSTSANFKNRRIIKNNPIVFLSREKKKQNSVFSGDSQITEESFKVGDGSFIDNYTNLISLPVRKESEIKELIADAGEHWIEPLPPLYHFKRYGSSGNNDGQKYWAGLGFGSSKYDPNYSVNQSDGAGSIFTSNNFVNTGNSTSDNQTALSENMTSGTNAKLAINMGIQLKKRFILEGGLQFSQAQVTNTTNVVIENRYLPQAVALNSESASKNQVRSAAKQSAIVEYTYEDINMDNTFQFATIPLKAGVIIIDKKFDLRLNAGFVTDFYLGNTIQEKNDKVATIEFKPGSDTPYRDVNFSGLAGFTIGYNLVKHFDITLEPNYIRSFQSMTKNSSTFNTTPSSFGVIAGIRYNFH